MANRRIQRVLYGRAELVSPWFSNDWKLLQDGREMATLRRFGRLHVSVATLAEGERWLLEPGGHGVVRAVDASGEELARISRRSWIGRRWDLSGVGFAYELISRPRPRSWFIGVGGAPIAELRGSLVSYNHVEVDCTLSVPLEALLLAWHVIARPWEQAAAPRGLVPAAARHAPVTPRPSPATMEEAS